MRVSFHDGFQYRARFLYAKACIPSWDIGGELLVLDELGRSILIVLVDGSPRFVELMTDLAAHEAKRQKPMRFRRYF